MLCCDQRKNGVMHTLMNSMKRYRDSRSRDYPTISNTFQMPETSALSFRGPPRTNRCTHSFVGLMPPSRQRSTVSQYCYHQQCLFVPLFNASYGIVQVQVHSPGNYCSILFFWSDSSSPSSLFASSRRSFSRLISSSPLCDSALVDSSPNNMIVCVYC